MSAHGRIQAAGADVIELGLPFSDPLADGGAIQRANTCALAGGVSAVWVVQTIAEARKVLASIVPRALAVLICLRVGWRDCASCHYGLRESHAGLRL